MAKSGMYLHGKELLECQLDKLTEVQRLESKIETLHRCQNESLMTVVSHEKEKTNIMFRFMRIMRKLF